MPLQGDVFLNLLRNFRICWLGGRFGGGKTALAERLGIEFLDRGWSQYVVGNFPSVIHTDLDKVPDCKDVFIVLDEAGVWLEDKQFEKVTAFLRKRNLYVIVSSVLPVQMRARTLNVQRVFNGHAWGLNFWRYSAVLDYMRVKEKFFLNWRNPREIFGLYDTSYVTADDAGIVEWVIDAFTTSRQKAVKIFKPIAATVADRVDDVGWAGIQSLDSSRRVAEEVAQAADKVEDAVSKLNRRSRKRGR